MDKRCWLEIVYNWGDDGLTLVKSEDPELLELAKRRVIQEAKERLEFSQDLDEIVTLMNEAEVHRLECILSRLIQDDPDRRTCER